MITLRIQILTIRKQLQLVINKTLIIPLKEESEEVLEILSNFLEYLKEDTELIVVLDTKDDPTYKLLENTKKIFPNFIFTKKSKCNVVITNI